MDNVCIPMHLDAFALSPDCCEGDSKIAPYTQPNYTALRLDSHLIQHDVLDHVDFHNTSPASKNPRVADLGQKPPNNLKPHRMGVHLHWSLPRFYRTGTASTSSQNKPANDSSDPTNPVFPKIPNRWLVTRHIKNHQPSDPLPEFQSWVVESDAVRNLTDIGDDVDLESDVAPFVSYEGDPTVKNVLQAQSEVFLGQKFDLVGWKEASAQTHRPLTLMNSSNPLFPDYALHNTNVLSVLDDFSFKKNAGDKGFQFATKAECDYFVIGWHQNPDDDPLNSAIKSDLTSRLSQLMLQLDTSSAKDYGIKEDQTRCLIYGAIYDVKYDFSQKPESVADTSAKNFTTQVKMEPLSVGTTPLDSILTFLSAHETDADAIFGTAGNSLAEDITGLAQFLYATADEYDARVQAQDLMAHQSFAKTDGGTKWSFSKASPGPAGTPAVPSVTEIQTLRILNEAQTQLDATNRQLRSLRWELFAEWWKYVSEYIPDTEKLSRQAFYRPIVTSITQAIWGPDKTSGLLKTQSSLEAQIQSLQSDSFKSSVRDPFFTRTDPTLCVAGLDSGRPQDFLDTLTVMLDHELTSDTTNVTPIFAGASNPVPNFNGLQSTAAKLLAQCLLNADTANGADGLPQTTGFQAWGDRNPFVPLFIEWESIYYHIDIDKWDIQLQSTPWGHNQSYVRYVPTSLLSGDASNQTDFRSLSGRILVLPQPVFSLENIVTSILDNPPAGMQLAPGEEDFIRKNIRNMKFISAPLSGLTSHLLTRCEGAHVKPVVRVQGQQIQPLADAAAPSQVIGIGSDVLTLVDAESALTPYGSLMTFGTDLYPKDKNPFKPVTHGQMLFTTLNIVDKFGQAICLPSPRPRLRNAPQPPDSKIYPCLSDYLAPDIIGTTVNTVFPTADAVQAGQIPPCEYVQLPPSINQDARINASFLIRDTISQGIYSTWREATEYENPVWGWIIINYADSGLQFFLADGTFYREIRVGGPNSETVSPKWLPNDPPAIIPTDAGTAQLDQLIAQLSPSIDGNAAYLQTFSDMINGSILNMPFPPSDYAGYANAIVGKPLALVNAGWSIELAAPAIKPQNSLGNATTNAQADLEAYSFPLKIGDIERAYDGVVGYYLSSNDPTNPTTEWSKLYTYFLPTPNSKFQDITQPSKAILPNLHPYWLDPSTTNITAANAAKYTVTSLLMDPYTDIHAFSPILPTKSLTLPPWVIQTAFQKMHAFFHLGPNLYTSDIPRSISDAKVAGTVLKMPVSGNKGTWSWFQPYATSDPTQLDPQYANMEVQEDLVGEKWAKGPYTFLEGYLQLMGNLQGKSS